MIFTKIPEFLDWSDRTFQGQIIEGILVSLWPGNEYPDNLVWKIQKVKEFGISPIFALVWGGRIDIFHKSLQDSTNLEYVTSVPKAIADLEPLVDYMLYVDIKELNDLSPKDTTLLDENTDLPTNFRMWAKNCYLAVSMIRGIFGTRHRIRNRSVFLVDGLYSGEFTDLIFSMVASHNITRVIPDIVRDSYNLPKNMLNYLNIDAVEKFGDNDLLAELSSLHQYSQDIIAGNNTSLVNWNVAAIRSYPPDSTKDTKLPLIPFVGRYLPNGVTRLREVMYQYPWEHGTLQIMDIVEEQ